MRQQRSKDCFHKIVAFQNHKNCQQIAAICEKKCQSYHQTNNPPSKITVDVVHNQFNKIKNRLIQEMKLYSDKFTMEYEELMKFFQKKYTQNLRQMERQMLNLLIKNINMNKDVLDKIDNERLEKLKCNEIYSFLQEQTGLEQKIKSAPLSPIYDKHLNSLRLHHKNFSWNSTNESNQQNIKTATEKNGNSNAVVSENQVELLKKSNQNYKNQINSLNQQKIKLKNQLIRLRQQKIKNFSRNTWDFFKVITRKRLKNANKNNGQTVINHPQETVVEPMIAENGQKSANINENNDFDSEEIIDFIEKKRKS